MHADVAFIRAHRADRLGNLQYRRAGRSSTHSWPRPPTVAGTASGTFADKNVGTDKTVTIAGITAGGTDGGNYTVTQPTTTAEITQATLTVTGVTASDKAYDGNTTATVDATSAAFVGVLGGDTVTVGGTATGTFADYIIGTDKTVTIADITAGGADGGQLPRHSATATASITATPSGGGGGGTPNPTPTPTPTTTPDGEPVVTRTNEDSTPVTAGQPISSETESASGGTAGGDIADDGGHRQPRGTHLAGAGPGERRGRAGLRH